MFPAWRPTHGDRTTIYQLTLRGALDDRVFPVTAASRSFRRNPSDVDVIGPAQVRARKVRSRDKAWAGWIRGRTARARSSPTGSAGRASPRGGGGRGAGLHGQLLDLSGRCPLSSRREGRSVRQARTPGSRPGQGSRTIQPESERDLVGAELRLEGRHRRPREADPEPGRPKIGLHPLSKRRERHAVDCQVARVLECHLPRRPPRPQVRPWPWRRPRSAPCYWAAAPRIIDGMIPGAGSPHPARLHEFPRSR